MIHRLMFLLAGAFLLLAAVSATTKPAVAFLCLINALVAYVIAYIKEHKYHTALFNQFLAQQQNKPH